MSLGRSNDGDTGRVSVARHLRAWVVLLLTVCLLISMVGCGKKPPADGGTAAGGQPESTEKGEGETKEETAKTKVKVALLLPGPIDDAGWNGNAYKGLVEAAEKFGIETSYMEKIPQAEFEAAFRDYASQGYDLVIGHGFEFQDAAKKVAGEFPEVKFVVFNGSVSAEPNLASVHFLDWQPGYLAGAVAGLITKTNRVGVIGGLEIPVIKSAVDAYKVAAETVNPKVKVASSYVGTFEDIAKGKETALAMINNGADVIMCDADQVGVGSIMACKEKGVYAVGFVNDQSEVAPDTVIASALYRTGVLVEYAVKNVVEGTFKSEVVGIGIKEGAHGLVWNPKFKEKMPDTVSRLDQIIKDMIDGKIEPPEGSTPSSG
ncbi:MAG TPA: BMP family ABC transporter substrate-binding protein [Clostridia bacterium]|nr:BMP family ABC transporter substrate-binding protein [Clostridia bacterium]